MTHKETVKRNIGLTFDFVNYLIDNQTEIEKLPSGFTLEFIKKDSSKLQHNHSIREIRPEPVT
ncbi:MAG: hypothetical protein LBI82_04875 [Dysgonamonadaceae bacterium]|jgi:hypothetical protein|nr:hypothetical protein [Dysgonamonadaceae bacterium]